MNQTPTSLRAVHLSCGYSGKPVLCDINITIAPGEFVGLCGPNGAGKTTLLLALSGLLTPHEGRIELDGADLATLPARQRARRISCVPQKIDAPVGFTVRELVLMGRYAHTGLLAGYGPDDHAAVDAALAQTNTQDLAERQAVELSGGELQRVLLARALSQGRNILLLDEAASAMDMGRRVEAYDLLASLNKAGTTVLSALHDLNLAALYCPRLIFLKAGRIVLDGATTEIFTESNLKDIYETELRVAPHPVTGAPQAHLVPGAGRHPAPGNLGN